MERVIEAVTDYSLGIQSKAIGESLQQLNTQQIIDLESNGNISNDWSRLLFHCDALASGNISLKRIQRCVFNVPSIHDNIIINDLQGNIEVNEFMMMCGLRDTTFIGTCIISKHCLITSTFLIANAFIGESCAIIGCGQIIGPSFINNKKKTTSFGNDEIISIGPENGGRDIKANINHSYYDLFQQVYKLSNDDNESENCIGDTANKLSNNNNIDSPSSSSPTNIAILSSSFAIICSNCTLFKCDSIIECFVGESCYLSSSNIAHSTLLSSAPLNTSIRTTTNGASANGSNTSINTIECIRGVKVTNNASISYCLIHAGCTINNHCIVDHVYMSESSCIDIHARVCQSILAPDVMIAGGECHHSVIGPFVGFHHHSLLIACLWPLGRGNIAYGAKIGANHTGRVNDQECWLGEGCFLGLNSSFKYPVNLLESPYSIIAPNTALVPQIIQLPFSLILTLPMTMIPMNSNNNNNMMMTVMNLQLQTVRSSLSPEIVCLIKPAWILYGNPYMLDRADIKFASRSKSHHYHTSFPVLRPSLIATVSRARDRVHDFLLRTGHIEKERRKYILIVDEFNNSKNNSTINGSNSTIQQQQQQQQPISSSSSSSPTKQLLGLGKCAVLLIDLGRALVAYNELIRRYALHGLLYLLLMISDAANRNISKVDETVIAGDDNNSNSVILSLIKQVSRNGSATVDVSTATISNIEDWRQQQANMVQQDLLYFKPIVPYTANTANQLLSLLSAVSNVAVRTAEVQQQQQYNDINLLKTLLPGTTDITALQSSISSSSSCILYDQLLVLSREFSSELTECHFFETLIEILYQQQHNNSDKHDDDNDTKSANIITTTSSVTSITASSTSSSQFYSSSFTIIVHKLLTELIQIEQIHADKVTTCREKDTERGMSIIPDYCYVNSAAVNTTDSTTTTTTTAVNITNGNVSTNTSDESGKTSRNNNNVCNDSIVKAAQKRAQDIKTLVTIVLANFNVE